MINWQEVQQNVQAGDYVAIANTRSALQVTMATLGDLVARGSLDDEESLVICEKLQDMKEWDDRLMGKMTDAARVAFRQEEAID